MKWIKATKQLPEKAGFYVVRAKSAAVFGGQAYFNEKRFEFRQGVHESEIEWLDESPSPLSGEEKGATHGQEMISDAQEILYLNVPAKCYDNELQCLVNCPEKYVLNAMSLYAASLLIQRAGELIGVIEKERSACEATIKHTDGNKSMIEAMNNQIAAFDICLKHINHKA